MEQAAAGRGAHRQKRRERERCCINLRGTDVTTVGRLAALRDVYQRRPEGSRDGAGTDLRQSRREP